MTVQRRTDHAPAILLGHTALDRAAFCALFRAQVQIEFAATGDYSPTAVWGALRVDPHFVVALADAPTAQVVEALQMTRRLRPRARVLVLASMLDPAHADDWGRCGLAGIVAKDADLPKMHAAVDAVLGGNTALPEEIRFAGLRRDGRPGAAPRLSPREAELLPLLARGMTLREAAAAMSVSYKTADTYRTSLLRKIGVHDRAHLVRYAIRRGLIEP